MIIYITFVFFLVSSCSARPNSDINLQNVVTVPPNCPDGQAWVNGECRDIWRVTAAPANVVTVPPNCPEGQQYVNGECRDIWFKTVSEQNILREVQTYYDFDGFGSKNVVTAPPNCGPGQQWINGSCRDVWRSGADTKNVVTVPPNCPGDQVYVNGQCRDVWRSSPNQFENYINNLKNLLKRQTEDEGLPNQVDTNRNVISVPDQCPVGYKPDALGNCRPVMN